MRGWLRRLLVRSAADGRALRAGRRRLWGIRGSAYVEFAFLAPFFLMFASLLIELATFWDASVMANHAAWQVGRIVKVKQDASLFKIKAIKPDSEVAKKAAAGLNELIGLANEFGDQRTLTTVMLMSGSAMGYTGQPGHELGDLFSVLVSAPIALLTDEDGGLSAAIGKDLAGKLPDLSSIGISSGDLLGGLASTLMEAIAQPILNAVVKEVLTPVTSWAQRTLNGLGEKISKALEQDGATFSYTKHYARNLQKAYQRIYFLKVGAGKKSGPLVKVLTANEGDVQFLQPQGTLRQPYVKGGGTGLKGQIAYVRVRWPMASDWLFPLFWGGDRSGKGVWATGHCLTLLEPALKNDNLKSTDPAAYVRPEENPQGPYKAVSDQIRHDLKIELFLLRYRNVRESLHMGGNVSEGGLLTAHHIQEWQSIAYGGKNYPAEYKKSWSAALDGTKYGNRGLLASHLSIYLNGGGGYHRREWLCYDGGTQRYRYCGTQGGVPTATTTATPAATAKRWDDAAALAQAHGQASGVAAGLAARLDSARSRAKSATEKLGTLRKWLDETIAELAKRVGEEQSAGTNIELDPDTMRSLSGDDLTGGDTEVTPEALQKQWKQTYAELKALRNQINDVAREVGLACGTIGAVNGRLAQETAELERDITAANKEEAKDEAFASLGAALETLHNSANQLGNAADGLGAKVDEAMALEIRFAQTLRLKTGTGLDPSKVDWGVIAEQVAQDDGTGDANLGKEDGKLYGDPDGKGDGPWTR